MKSNREKILELCECSEQDFKNIPINGNSRTASANVVNHKLLPIITALLDRVEQLEGAFGCHSHSCRLVKPKGMGVNGPCRCIDNIKHVLTATSPLDEILNNKQRSIDQKEE